MKTCSGLRNPYRVRHTHAHTKAHTNTGQQRVQKIQKENGDIKWKVFQCHHPKLQQNSSKLKIVKSNLYRTISHWPLFDHLITEKFFDGNHCPQWVNPNDQEFWLTTRRSKLLFLSKKYQQVLDGLVFISFMFLTAKNSVFVHFFALLLALGHFFICQPATLYQWHSHLPQLCPRFNATLQMVAC